MFTLKTSSACSTLQITTGQDASDRERKPGDQFLVSLSQTLLGVLKYLFNLASVYSSLYKYIKYVKLFYLLAERILRQEHISTK